MKHVVLVTVSDRDFVVSVMTVQHWSKLGRGSETSCRVDDNVNTRTIENTVNIGNRRLRKWRSLSSSGCVDSNFRLKAIDHFVTQAHNAEYIISLWMRKDIRYRCSQAASFSYNMPSTLPYGTAAAYCTNLR